MQTEQWDNEAKKLAHEVLSIESELQRLFKTEKAALIRKKVAVGHYQVVFDQMVDGFQKLAKRPPPKKPQHAAIVHWGVVLAREAQGLYKKRSKFLGHHLWLHLIKARLTGNGGSANLLVNDNDLLELALRHNQLKESEGLLRNELTRLQQFKQLLHRRYDRDQAAHMNIEASGTLQGQFGDGIDDALNHPSYRALERFFRRLSLKVRGPSHKEAEIEDFGRRIVAETNHLVAACRDLILKPSSKAVPNAKFENLKKSIESLDHMQGKMLDLSEQVLSYQPPPARPIFLKKDSVRATRDVPTRTSDTP